MVIKDRTRTLSGLALAVGICLSTGVFSSDEELGIPHSDSNIISSEAQAAVRELVSSAKQRSQAMIDSGELDWLEAISAQHSLSANPLTVEADNTAAMDPEQEPRPEHPLGTGFKTLIFVSWSMGEPAIRDILSRYDGDPSTAIVFRGVPEGQPFAQAVMAIQALSLDTESALSVLIDPIAYKTHGITTVPSIAIETPEGATLIKATGISSPDRLRYYLDDDQVGDLGQLGPTHEIAERDMIELAQERIAELDFDQMKERAQKNFWHQQTGHFLPTSIEDRVRHIDPSIIVHEDILDSMGNVVTAAGKINPLDIMPFDQKLVIIDPSSSWQVALAADVVRNTGDELVVTIMATQIDPEDGWGMFSRTEESIDAALYLLPPALASRFSIEKTPSIVTADDQTFIVREFSKAAVEEGLHVR